MFKTIALTIASTVAVIFAAHAATAADITVKSAYYSTNYMVPHIHYEGPVLDGDIEALQAVFDRVANCREECAPAEGRPNAVLTLSSPGGNYAVGLDMAHFLRNNHIATRVEADATCYSACAFMFLGGSAYSSQDSIGSYPDRIVEPGGIVGYHAPYFDDATLQRALEELGSDVVMGDNRRNYAIMVNQLVNWNVDPLIIGWMVHQGPDETYDLVTSNDLYLTRTALPPTPPRVWIEEPGAAIRNVCLRLMSDYQTTEPAVISSTFPTEFTADIGQTESGQALSGFVLGDNPLDIGMCAVTNESFTDEGNYDVALYLAPGIGGFSRPVLSFFNRVDGWSTLGIGASPSTRVFQKGSINHYFLDPLGDLETQGQRAALPMIAAKFFAIGQPAPPAAPEGFEVVYEDYAHRIARKGDIWVYLQSGNIGLFRESQDADELGVTISADSRGETAFFRAGNYQSNGNPFSIFGAMNDVAAAVMRIEVEKPAGTPLTDEELTTLRQLQCTMVLAGQQLTCS